jgi:hypothetical protein
VGGSTAAVILAQKVAPLAGNRWLARTGYDSQQFDGHASSVANLWRPVDETCDAGTHGSFGARAHSRSVELWTTKHRWLVAGLAVAAAATRLVMRMRA